MEKMSSSDFYSASEFEEIEHIKHQNKTSASKNHEVKFLNLYIQNSFAIRYIYPMI